MTAIITRAEAKSQGLKRYFSGLPCMHGHVAERFTSSGRCTECQRNFAHSDISREKAANYRAEKRDHLLEYNKKHYQENRDRYRAQQKEYAVKNAEALREKQKLYRDGRKDVMAEYKRQHYARNRDAILEKCRLYHLENAEARCEYQRQYRANNPEAIRVRRSNWEAANPEAKRTHHSNRRARLRGAEGSHTVTEILDLLKKQKCRCAICGVSIKGGYHKDHIQPLALGGSNWISNVQLACGPCNMRKNAKDPIQFARENGRLL